MFNTYQKKIIAKRLVNTMSKEQLEKAIKNLIDVSTGKKFKDIETALYLSFEKSVSLIVKD